MSNETSTDVTDINTIAEAIMISGYINFSFFVCEIGMRIYGPTGQLRHNLDMMAHILAGPISFLGFLNGGFMGSLFFFLSLWHFMCDSGRARPSLIRELPRTVEEGWVWFESFWLLLHHWYIGTMKLLSTDLASQMDYSLQAGSLRFLIRTWILGATLSHLSFGMDALHMKGHVTLRALSVGFRMGAALAIFLSPKYPRAVQLVYLWDICWMTVILSLTLRKALCASRANINPKGAIEMTTPSDKAGASSEDLEQKNGDAQHFVQPRACRPSMSEPEAAMEQRLTQRIRMQSTARA